MGQEKLHEVVERSDETGQANSEILDEGPGLTSQSPATYFGTRRINCNFGSTVAYSTLVGIINQQVSWIWRNIAHFRKVQVWRYYICLACYEVSYPRPSKHGSGKAPGSGALRRYSPSKFERSRGVEGGARREAPLFHYFRASWDIIKATVQSIGDGDELRDARPVCF
jgi:hypothetical protein